MLTSDTAILLASSVCPWISYFWVCSRTTSLNQPSGNWSTVLPESLLPLGSENVAPSKSSATKYLVIKLPV